MPNLFQTARRQHEHQPGDSDRKVWSSSLWPTLIASSGKGMASVGGALVPAGACRRRASQPKFRSMLTRYFNILGPQAEINRDLLATLDLEADGFAVGRNITDDVHDKWRRSAASLFFMGCQSWFPGALFYRGLESERVCATYLVRHTRRRL